jgi:hypothetical protein
VGECSLVMWLKEWSDLENEEKNEKKASNREWMSVGGVGGMCVSVRQQIEKAQRHSGRRRQRGTGREDVHGGCVVLHRSSVRMGDIECTHSSETEWKHRNRSSRWEEGKKECCSDRERETERNNRTAKQNSRG